MKVPWMLPLACIMAGPLLAEDAVIHFSNHDQLSGVLESFSQDQLIWKSPILEKPTPFYLRQVAELTLPSRLPEISANHEAIVKLTNGDTVTGQLAGVSSESVELDTWYAGRMSFRRAMVADMEIRELPEILYQGPTGMDGWVTRGDDPWIYQGNAFVTKSPSIIGRDLQLPDTCSISFQMEWRGTIRTNVIFFSKESGDEEPESGYQLSIQRRSVRFTKTREHEWIGHTTVPSLQINEKAQIEIRSNLKTGQFAFFMDGKLVDVWTDTSMVRTDLGGGLRFMTEDETPLRISSLRVSAWDGVIDQAPPPKVNGRFWQDEDEESAENAMPNADDHKIQLRNGDFIAGDVLSIQQDVITIRTPYGEVRLPLSRLTTLPMGSAALERAIRRKGDVRAWLADGSAMVFRLDAAGEGMITGSSQNFGSARFKVEAFTRIEFNIYDKDSTIFASVPGG